MVKVKGKSEEAPSNKVMVVGGGVAGIRAALDLAEAGFMVNLVDQQPYIGGVLMQLDRQFPTNDCGICKMLPTIMRNDISECCMRRNLSHPKIKVYTNSSVEKVTGTAGNFTIDMQQKPQFVDPSKCITCGKCEEICPIEAPNEFNENLATRKAIFKPYPLPNPDTYTLDSESCNRCGECVSICPTDAINLNAKEQNFQVNAGSVILAPGLQVFDPKPNKAYSYGTNPNIITSLDFERIYSGLGPYSGERILTRPSDQEIPKTLAFIQCVGSRNTQFGHEYCSYACCMYSLKEAIIAKEQNPDIDVSIFYMDMRAFGKSYHEYYLKAKDLGINFIRCRVPAVQSISGTDNLELTLVTESGEISKQEFELVVLAVGLEAPRSAPKLGEIFGIKLDDDGFSIANEFAPVSTSKPGIYVCGAFTGPKDIPESVTDASAAAAAAEKHLSKPDEAAQETSEQEKEAIITSGEPSIGIILCSCGDDIESKLDLNELEEYAKTLTSVEIVDKIDYLCIKPEEIKNIIEKSDKKINKVIIGACVPYHFELRFKEAAFEAGINPANLELINLRERLAWVCLDESETLTTPTAMAKGQLLIAYKKLLAQEKFSEETNQTPVIRRALVVGGGLAGLTSAITLANNDIEVDLVEKTKSLGGNLKNIYSTLVHEDVQKFLKSTIKNVEENNNISIHLNSEVQDISGHVGVFKATIAKPNVKDGTRSSEYGAIILATGATEYVPNEYLYGKNPRVWTQLELESALAGNELENKNKSKIFKAKSEIKSIAMIQCVGSRNSEHPYCSRVCCAKAIKNALTLKNDNPGVKVYIIYQDIMTYGLQEKYFLAAREAGIEFLRYEPEDPPVATNVKGTDKLTIKLKDILLNQELTLKPELLVLSTGIVPNTKDLDAFDRIGIEYSPNYFLQEANVKFRPVDMLADGIFIAGLVHSPRQMSESIIQAQAAAGRALTILNKSALPIRREVSVVNTRKCSGCEACVTVCPYHARIMDADEKVAVVIEPLCQSCGACAMVCPNGAAIMRGFRRGQLYGMIDAAVFS